MTKDQLELLDKEYNALITASDLTPKDRTLLYGYTCNRETFHVYLKNGEIHVVIYGTDYSSNEIKPKDMRERFVLNSNAIYIPDKRLYPDKCDYEFCKLLMQKGFSLPFTSWNENTEKSDFYGFTLEDHINLDESECATCGRCKDIKHGCGKYAEGCMKAGNPYANWIPKNDELEQ